MLKNTTMSGQIGTFYECPGSRWVARSYPVKDIIWIPVSFGVLLCCIFYTVCIFLFFIRFDNNSQFLYYIITLVLSFFFVCLFFDSLALVLILFAHYSLFRKTHPNPHNKWQCQLAQQSVQSTYLVYLLFFL